MAKPQWILRLRTKKYLLTHNSTGGRNKIMKQHVLFTEAILRFLLGKQGENLQRIVCSIQKDEIISLRPLDSREKCFPRRDSVKSHLQYKCKYHVHLFIHSRQFTHHNNVAHLDEIFQMCCYKYWSIASYS